MRQTSIYVCAQSQNRCNFATNGTFYNQVVLTIWSLGVAIIVEARRMRFHIFSAIFSLNKATNAGFPAKKTNTQLLFLIAEHFTPVMF